MLHLDKGLFMTAADSSADQVSLHNDHVVSTAPRPAVAQEVQTQVRGQEASQETPRAFFSPDAKPGEVEVTPKALQDSLQALVDRFKTVQRLAGDPKGVLSSTDRLVLELFKDGTRLDQIAKLLTNKSPATEPLKADAAELNGLSFTNQEKAAIVLILEQTSRDYAYAIGRRSGGVEQTLTTGLNWRKIPPENIQMTQINYQWEPIDLAGREARITHVEQSSFQQLRLQEKEARLQGMGATIAKLTEELTGRPISDVMGLGNISMVETTNIQRSLMETSPDDRVRGLAQDPRPLEALWNLDPALAIQIEHDSYDIAARREATQLTQQVLAEKYDASRPFRGLVLKQAEVKLTAMQAKKVEMITQPTGTVIVRVEDTNADQERLKTLNGELTTAKQTVQQNADRIAAIDIRLGDLQGTTGEIAAKETDLNNYQHQYDLDKAAITGSVAQQQASLNALNTRLDTLNKLRVELHSLQLEERNLARERKSKERENTTLQPRVDYLSQLNIQEVTTASPQDQIDAGAQIMEVAKKHVGGNQGEGLNEVLKGILGGSAGAETRKQALQSMDNLRLVLGMDVTVLSDRQLRNIIASQIGFKYEDMQDVDPRAAETNRNLLSALAARNPYEFALVLDATIDNRLNALAQGKPTEFLAVEIREPTLEFVKALETVSDSLHRQGIIEGINCVRYQHGIDIEGEHYEIICSGNEPMVYKLQTQKDRSRKLVSLGNIGISQVGTNYVLEQASAEVMAIRQQILQETWLNQLKQRTPGHLTITDNRGVTRRIKVEPGGKLYIETNVDELGQRLLNYAVENHKNFGWILNKLGLKELIDKRITGLPGYESVALKPWEWGKAIETTKRFIKDIPLEAYLQAYPGTFDHNILPVAADILLNNANGLRQRGVEIHNEIEASHNGAGREGTAVYKMLDNGVLEITWSEPGRAYRRCKQTFYPDGMTQGDYGVGRRHIRILRQKAGTFLGSPNVSINNPNAPRQTLANNYRHNLNTAIADSFIQMTNEERRQFDFHSVGMGLRDIAGTVVPYEISMDKIGHLLIRDTRRTENQPQDLNDFLNRQAIDNIPFGGIYPTNFLHRYLYSIRTSIGQEFMQSLARSRRQ
jgi:uncharacterized coiled-coil protein SlyX